MPPPPMFVVVNILTVLIDVSQKELDVSLGNMDAEASTHIYAYRTFLNTEKGFTAMLLWIKKQTDVDSPVRFVMEATGVYHEALIRLVLLCLIRSLTFSELWKEKQ